MWEEGEAARQQPLLDRLREKARERAARWAATPKGREEKERKERERDTEEERERHRQRKAERKAKRHRSATTTGPGTTTQAQGVATGHRSEESALRPRVTGEYRLGDVRHVVASPARAAEELGFRAQVSPSTGLPAFATAPLRA